MPHVYIALLASLESLFSKDSVMGVDSLSVLGSKQG